MKIATIKKYIIFISMIIILLAINISRAADTEVSDDNKMLESRRQIEANEPHKGYESQSDLRKRINYVYKDGLTGFHVAIMKDSYYILKNLPAPLPNYNITTPDGYTPLHLILWRLQSVESTEIRELYVNLAMWAITMGKNGSALSKSGLHPVAFVDRCKNIDEVVNALISTATSADDFTSLGYYYKNSNPDKAFGYVNNALSIAPDYEKAKLLKAELLLASNKIEQSDQIYIEIMTRIEAEIAKDGKRDPNKLGSMGWSAMLSGNLESAERYIKEASNAMPNAEGFEMNMGHVYLLQNNKDEAVIKYKHAISMAKENKISEKIFKMYFDDDFLLLKARYKDKEQLINSVQMSLFEPKKDKEQLINSAQVSDIRVQLEPISFSYPDIPFGKTEDDIKKLLEIATVSKRDRPVAGFLDKILKGKFKAGLYKMDQNVQFSPELVNRYDVSYSQWENIDKICLFFASSENADEAKKLFLVSKYLKPQPEDYAEIFNSRKNSITAVVKTQPVISSSDIMSLYGRFPVKIAIWMVEGKEIILDVYRDPMSGAATTRISYLSVNGWNKYLNAINKSESNDKIQLNKKMKKDF